MGNIALISFQKENTKVMLVFIYRMVIDMSLDVLLGIFLCLCVGVCLFCILCLALFASDNSDNALAVFLMAIGIASAYMGYQCYLALGW